MKKIRPGKQRRFAVRGNHARVSNGILPFEENAPGRATAFCRSEKSRRDKENLFGWRSFLRWGSTTRAGFGQNRAGARKTFLGGSRFCAGEAPPARGSALSESNLEIDGYEIIAVLLINVSPIAFLGFHFAVVFHGNLSQLGIRQFLAF